MKTISGRRLSLTERPHLAFIECNFIHLLSLCLGAGASSYPSPLQRWSSHLGVCRLGLSLRHLPGALKKNETGNIISVPPVIL